MTKISDREWAYRSAAMGLILAEQNGQRPKAVQVNPHSHSAVAYQVEKQPFDNWATPRQQYYYAIGWELIPSLATDLSKDPSQILREFWQRLFDKSLVKSEVVDDSSTDWQEMYAVANQVILFFRKHEQSCLKIASLLTSTNQLRGSQIDAALEEFGLVFERTNHDGVS